MSNPNRILVVEDDQTIALGIEYSLKQEGYLVDVRHDAASAREALAENRYQLVLLDISLPDGTGFDLCRLIRKTSDTPVIFLTARDDEVNIVMGLDMGADDYVTKPFRVRELLSRIKSVLRRYPHQDLARQQTIRIGDVTIYPDQARVIKRGQDILLTAMEYKLLLTLATHQGQVLTRHFQRIFKTVTGQPFNKYLQHMRIQRSCHLLIHTTLTVQQIAAQVGYADMKFFHTLFRRITGCTPQQYRQLNR